MEADIRSTEAITAKDIQKLERNMSAKDQQIFNLQKVVLSRFIVIY